MDLVKFGKWVSPSNRKKTPATTASPTTTVVAAQGIDVEAAPRMERIRSANRLAGGIGAPSSRVELRQARAFRGHAGEARVNLGLLIRAQSRAGVVERRLQLSCVRG